MALDTLRTNKMRSGLTVLGVVIGITSIVGMTALIRGFDESLRDTIRTIGPDTIYVAKFSGISASAGTSFEELMRRPNMTPADADAIERLAPSVGVVDVVFGRAVFEPGWKWSECVKPIAGTDLCMVHHNGFVVSGSLHIVMEDGTEYDINPGDVFVCPPGHDAWVTSHEACVAYDFSRADWFQGAMQGEFRRVDHHISPFHLELSALAGDDSAWNYHLGFAAPVRDRFEPTKIRGVLYGLVNWWFVQDLVSTQVITDAFRGLVEEDRTPSPYAWLWAADASKILAHKDRGLYYKLIGKDMSLALIPGTGSPRHFHGKVSPALARLLIKGLEPHQPMFVEEPVLPEQMAHLPEVVAASTVPVALGERLELVPGVADPPGGTRISHLAWLELDARRRGAHSAFPLS